MRAATLFAAAAIAAFAALPEALADKRVALVIGNDDYAALTDLNNPAGDAKAIGAALAAKGFDVLLHQNLDRASFLDALDDFRFAADGADVALVYYAGHGMEIGGRNVVAPVDADIDCETEQSRRIVPVEQLYTALSTASNQILILDSCRNDPFPQCKTKGTGGTGGFRGLTRDTPASTRRLLVANATAAGQLASDGKAGEHSPFTAALLRRIEAEPGKLVLFTFDSVARDVTEATGGTQVPEVFAPGGAPPICFAGEQCGDTDGDGGAGVAALEAEVADLRKRLALATSGDGAIADGVVRESSDGDAALREEIDALKEQLARAEARPLPPPVTRPPAVVLPPGSTKTLTEVRSRGYLNCGVSTGNPGFSERDNAGVWRGLDADLCRGVAVAVLGDPAAVEFVPLSARDRFVALQRGEIDVLIRNTAHTASRENDLGLRFAGTNFYDGLALMVSRSLGIGSARELAGATVCVQNGTTTELGVYDFFDSVGMDFTPASSGNWDDAVAAYAAGRCDVIANDASFLYTVRRTLPVPEDHVVLPERLTREALGPYVRDGDANWLNIVQNVLNAAFWAEEYGVTSANVGAMRDSAHPAVRRLLGEEGGLGESLGLRSRWAADVIAAIGNYGEMFDRNLGRDSPFRMARGQNDLAARGGLIAAPALR